MGKLFTNLFKPFVKQLLAEKPVLPNEPIKTNDEEIPRYPPFMQGLPTAPVDRVVATQVELISAIEQALALPNNLYQSIALPVIERYAAFSHLLPASESHHHRGAGGLFRHGLEVAHWATLASQDCLFATQSTPRERKEQEPRWRLAICFAGLLHDIGKPVSDIAVVNRQGNTTWNPCDENLTDWAKQHNVDRYFLRWRENRHKRHEQFSALVIERVLTRESRSYILALGPDIMQAMLETIHGLDRGSKLYELIMTADRKSVERDLKSHYHNVDSAMGMPVEKYLFDAMRRLIKSGKWLINDKGARVWRFKDGVHIVWRTGAQDIVELLAKDKVPGIPRDEDTLADILIERGLAVSKSLQDGRQYRYWRMQPEGIDVVFYMLRLTSAELIFSNEPPAVIEGFEIETTVDLTNDDPKQSVKKSAETANSDKLSSVLIDSAPKLELALVDSNAQQSERLSNSLINAIELKPIANLEANASGHPELSPTSVLVEVQSPLPNEQPTQCQLMPHQIDSDNLLQKANSSETLTQKISQSVCAKSRLQAHGLVGEWLIKTVTKINEGNWQLSIPFSDSNDKCLLPFPQTPQMLNIDPNDFIKTLEDKGWIVTDVLSPMRKVQTINQVRGVLLAREPSELIKQLLTEVTQTTFRPTEKHPACRKSLAPPTPNNSKKTSAKPVKIDKTETALKVDSEPTLAEPNAKSTIQPPLIATLISYVEQSMPKSATQIDSQGWRIIEEAEIEAFIKCHPHISRNSLLREMSSDRQHCLITDRTLKVRVKS